jgi:Leucine-rich repeat (LRR) protein
LETFYNCEIKSGSIEEMGQKFIENISGDHLSGYNNSNVKALHIFGVKTFYMPLGLEQYFKDLIVIDIFRAGLKEVHKEDIKPFINLRFLSFAENSLTHLENDLFINNPKLEVIFLWKNQIKTVDSAFKNLINIRNIDFTGNECFSGYVNDKNQIGNLITSIYSKCKLPFKLDPSRYC